jgi:hypothetical protein
MSTPKKYTTTPTNQTITSPTTGIPRTPNKHHTTPKKTLPVRSVSVVESIYFIGLVLVIVPLQCLVANRTAALFGNG